MNKRIWAALALLVAGAWASAQVNGQGGVWINGVLQGGAGGGANTALSNLAATAVSVDIVPHANQLYALGSPSLAWGGVYATGIYGDMTTSFMLTSASPAAAAGSLPGWDMQIYAADAIAGDATPGAASGGNVSITAGAAARLSSGNANGGDITLTPGAGIGSGITGSVTIPNDSSQLKFGASSDVGIARAAAGVLKVTNGTTGYGVLRLSANSYLVGGNTAVNASIDGTDQTLASVTANGYRSQDPNGGRYSYSVGTGWTASHGYGPSMASSGEIVWSNDATYYGTFDVGIKRLGPGSLGATDGSTGQAAWTASGYTAGSSAGMTTVITVRDSGGSANCTITVTGGIITATTCSHT